jgi:hypothetical protein
MAYPLLNIGLDFHEMPAIPQNASQLAGLRMERRVEDKVTAIFTTDAIIGLAG